MRGLYGQSQGDERRVSTEQFCDRLAENDVAEGQHVRVLRRMAKEKAWQSIEGYTARLRSEGHGHNRVESMLTRAMVGLKF